MLQLQLIALYDFVCRYYDTHPAPHFQRQSNNAVPAFTDQELMTVYLFGLLQQRFTLSQTYTYILNHWDGWFPQMPSCQALNYRINQIGWPFEGLVDALTRQLQTQPCLAHVQLTDSLPVIFSKRPDSAKVALNWADKSFCPTKKLYDHGLKLHLIASDRLGQMPLPTLMQFSPASLNDLPALPQQVVALGGVALVGDKAYGSSSFRNQLAQQQAVVLHTPIKLAKGQKRLEAADNLYSTYVSRMRQPIESLFNWLIEHTQLQQGSKIRSERGALLHCFGRLAAGLYRLLFNP